MIDYKDICSKIESAAREAGKFIKRESIGFDISRTENKGLHDFVSYVDKESERMLVEKLAIILPEAGFLAEEGTSSKISSEYCWVIDPLMEPQISCTDFILMRSVLPLQKIMCQLSELFMKLKEMRHLLPGKAVGHG